MSGIPGRSSDSGAQIGTYFDSGPSVSIKYPEVQSWPTPRKFCYAFHVETNPLSQVPFIVSSAPHRILSAVQ